MSVVPNVPAHLRRFVVEQDYSQYTAVDQAVWRFVLLQNYTRLVETAHPAYRDGLSATGISIDRIPSIAEMNERLSRFGWGAVCVDGFIPGRAFNEFQSLGLLPIAADIRSREHLVYTPAPDIVHEAAGHAPILPDPVFSAYVRRLGEMARKAFTIPEEDRVYRAIHALSEAKEDPAADTALIQRTEAELAAAVASVPRASEAARLSRLYWWTAEYGLVGRTDDYKLYGAGLLSSLWESHACHSPDVRKLPLDDRCLDVAYDITRPQPQLFVTRDFEALHELLDRIAPSFAASAGGGLALERALESEEVCSVKFASGLGIIGRLAALGPSASAPAWLRFDGPVAFATADGDLPPRDLERSDGYFAVPGLLESGRALALSSEADLARQRDALSGEHRFEFRSGVAVRGRFSSSTRASDGRLIAVELTDAHIVVPGVPAIELPRYRLFALDDAIGAEASAMDGRYYPDSEFPRVSVPKPRRYSPGDRAAIALYERVEAARARGGAAVADAFAAVEAELDRSDPDEWLLRWNLLEGLLANGERGRSTRELRRELERLEAHFERRQPIASGLRYLDARYG